ncbi:cytochrome c biogenesis CcdA family protein [Amnibacterium kyonggiense]|uniref:Cytochrome c-type biogenesis protein n=1 Tax=Amnibacterium kyonggiense TaxID=595671 RepID=A0A4R7FPI0_9MICO|nr:cytochrome c biogenesis protein CcdA [Amnibacterium kyonggiense]TDS79651.1 cytochrome c-type biogenesis protein [Amnibacterium kyonggiense]
MILQGGVLLAAPVALAAGLLSFASPCVLPLVPGYLGYVGGVDRSGARARSRVVLGAALFVLGFSLVFVLTSVVFATVGYFLVQYQDLITRLAGIVVILLGVVFVGGLGPLQQRFAPEWRPRAGLIGAPVLGAVFAVGWTPCLGPMLQTINVLSLSSGSLGAAAALAVCYSIGLGVPFVLLAVGFGWATGAVAVLRRNVRAINLAGGALLVVIGLLMLTGAWTFAVSHLQALVGSYVSPL